MIHVLAPIIKHLMEIVYGYLPKKTEKNNWWSHKLGFVVKNNKASPFTFVIILGQKLVAPGQSLLIRKGTFLNYKNKKIFFFLIPPHKGSITFYLSSTTIQDIQVFNFSFLKADDPLFYYINSPCSCYQEKLSYSSFY